MTSDPAAPHILYVTDGFAPQRVGGMQSYARRQLEAIAAAGYRLTSITPQGAAEPAEALAWRNIALPWPDRTAIDRLNPWRYANDLKRFSASVAEVIDNVAPDLVYAEGPMIHGWLRRRNRTIPAVFHPHGLDTFQPKGRLIDDIKAWPLRGLVAFHAHRADITICQSESGELMRILRDRIGTPPDRIAILPNAAPEARGPARTDINPRPRLLFVGRDVPLKGLSLLLNAFSQVEGATLDVVGASPAPAPHVTGHGEIRERARLDQFYRDADFLVVPSYAEGMPTVILEAFALGLPAIATDVGANGDMVRDGETGFLTPRGDRGALAGAIRKALSLSAADYSRISANCLAAAQGRFSADSAREALLALLDRALSGDKKH